MKHYFFESNLCFLYASRLKVWYLLAPSIVIVQFTSTPNLSKKRVKLMTLIFNTFIYLCFNNRICFKSCFFRFCSSISFTAFLIAKYSLNLTIWNPLPLLLWKTGLLIQAQTWILFHLQAKFSSQNYLPFAFTSLRFLCKKKRLPQ